MISEAWELRDRDRKGKDATLGEVMVDVSVACMALVERVRRQIQSRMEEDNSVGHKSFSSFSRTLHLLWVIPTK